MRLIPDVADMAKSRDWTQRFFSEPAHIPVSLKLDGKRVAGILAGWKPSITARRVDAAVTEKTFAGTDPQTGLAVRVECVEYADYPVVEWTAWFTNTGKRHADPQRHPRAGRHVRGQLAVLWHCNGDFCSGEGYTARDTPCGQGTSALCPRRGPAVRPGISVLPARVQGLRPVDRDRLAGAVVGVVPGADGACMSGPARRRPICG